MSNRERVLPVRDCGRFHLGCSDYDWPWYVCIACGVTVCACEGGHPEDEKVSTNHGDSWIGVCAQPECEKAVQEGAGVFFK